jgi:acetolactate synthase-1/2/3 large subunit
VGAQFYNYHKPRTLLTSGRVGHMGYGFLAAIGAQVAFPDKLVIRRGRPTAPSMMCIQEMATAIVLRPAR